MKVKVTVDMINKAIINSSLKISAGKQKKKVYNPNSNADQYYMNNIMGELGELVFAQAVLDSGHKLGVNPHTFGGFMNSDVCDFYSSKTAITIDVKTVHQHGQTNLLVNKRIADWRKIYNYVLVKLNTKEKLTGLDSLYKIEDAEILGSMTYRAVGNPSNIIKIERGSGKEEVYKVNSDRLTPVGNLVRTHFFKNSEHLVKYYSKGFLRIDIASIESGAVPGAEDIIAINEKAAELKSRYGEIENSNFAPKFFPSNNCVSFALYKGKFHTSLFLKALLQLEARARRLESTLVIPSYIEDYIPEKDKKKLIEIIENLRCDVQYVWSNNREYANK